MRLLFLIPLYIFQPDGVNLWLVILWLSDQTEYSWRASTVLNILTHHVHSYLTGVSIISMVIIGPRHQVAKIGVWGESNVSLSHIKAYYIIFQILNGMHKRRNDLNIFIYLTFEKTGIPQCSIQPAPEVSELFSTNIWIENSSVIWFKTFSLLRF